MDKKARLFIIGEALTHSPVFIDAFVDGTYDFLYCKNKPDGKRDYRVHPCTPDIVEKMPELEILTDLHDVVSSRYPDITWGIKP